MTRFAAWALPAGTPLPEGQVVRVPDDEGVVDYLPVTEAWIEELASSLKRAREDLMNVPAASIAAALGRAGARFLDPADACRRDALRLLPATAGISPAMAEVVVDGMARDWTEVRLRTLLDEEVGDVAALDGFVPGPRRHLRAMGPTLALQVVSGSVPGVGATALVRSLLVKGPTLVKPGAGDLVLPVLLARAVAEEDERLGAAVAVVYWPGGNTAVEAAAAGQAEVVVAYGGDDTVRSLRAHVPATTRFHAYHHRVSLGVVGREALGDGVAEATAAEVARAVAVFDQRGCVSPQGVFVEEGGATTPTDFAGMVAQALEQVEERLPSGQADASEAARVHQLRGTARMRAAAGAAVRVFEGEHALWTMVYDPEGGFQPGCVGRFVRVAPVPDIAEVPARLTEWRAHLQTVAVAGAGDRTGMLAEALGRAGASRVTTFEGVAFPPAWWRHDGQGALTPLLRWVESEL